MGRPAGKKSASNTSLNLCENTPLSNSKESMVETTSSGRRRIRPMKYNDFAGVQQKTPVAEGGGTTVASVEDSGKKLSRASHPPAEDLAESTPLIDSTQSKDSRRKRSFNKYANQTPEKAATESEVKRTRSHNTDWESTEPRSSKRKLALNDEDQTPTDVQHGATAIRTNRLKRMGQRGKSIAPTEPVVADENATERLPKRRRIMTPPAVEEIDSSHEKEDDIEQPVVRKRGRGRESKSAVKLKEAVAEPSHARRSNSRRHVSPDSATFHQNVDVDVNSGELSPKHATTSKFGENTLKHGETRRSLHVSPPPPAVEKWDKKVSARSLRLANRVETSTPRGRRSSRGLNVQEPAVDSPLTVIDDVSGDESLKSYSVVIKRGRGRRPRGRPSAANKRSLSPDLVAVDFGEISSESTSCRKFGQNVTKQCGLRGPYDIDDDDEHSSGILDEGMKMRMKSEAKVILADIFTKKGMKKRKRISPTMVKPGARASSRIAAVTLAASSPNPYGGASSDEQQPSAKKQLTLPQMLRGANATEPSKTHSRTSISTASGRNTPSNECFGSNRSISGEIDLTGSPDTHRRSSSRADSCSRPNLRTLPQMLRTKSSGTETSSPAVPDVGSAVPAVKELDDGAADRLAADKVAGKVSHDCATPTKESATKVIVTTPKLRGKRNGAQNDGKPSEEYSAEADDEMEEDIKLSNKKALIQMSNVVVSLKDINVDKKFVEGAPVKTTSLISTDHGIVAPSNVTRSMPTPQPIPVEKPNQQLHKKQVAVLNSVSSTTPSETSASPAKEVDGKSASERQLAAVAKKTKKSKIVELKEIEEPLVEVLTPSATPIVAPPAMIRSPPKSIETVTTVEQHNTESVAKSPKKQTDQALPKDTIAETESKPADTASKSSPSKDLRRPASPQADGVSGENITKPTPTLETGGKTAKQVETLPSTAATSLPIDSTEDAAASIQTTQTSCAEKISVIKDQFESPTKSDGNVSKSEETKPISERSSPLKKSPTKPTDKWTAESLDDSRRVASANVNSEEISPKFTTASKFDGNETKPTASALPENTTSVLKFNENCKSASTSPLKAENVKRPSVENRPNVIVDAPTESPEKSQSSPSKAADSSKVSPRCSSFHQNLNVDADSGEIIPPTCKFGDNMAKDVEKRRPNEKQSPEKNTEASDVTASGSERKKKGSVYKISDSESDSEVDGKKSKLLKTAEARSEESAKISPLKPGPTAALTTASSMTTSTTTTSPSSARNNTPNCATSRQNSGEISPKHTETSKFGRNLAKHGETRRADDRSSSVEATTAKNDSPTKQSKTLDFGQKALPIETTQSATTSRKNSTKTDKSDSSDASQPTKPVEESKATKPSDSKTGDANLHVKSETNLVQSARPQEQSDAAKANAPTGRGIDQKVMSRRVLGRNSAKKPCTDGYSAAETKIDAKTTQSATNRRQADEQQPNNRRATDEQQTRRHVDSMMGGSGGGGGGSGGGSSGGASNNSSSCASNRTEKHHSKNSQDKDKMASSMGSIPPQFPMNQLPNYHNTHPYWQWDTLPYAYHSSYNLSHLDPGATQKSPTKFHKDLANTMYGHGLPSNYLAANAQSQQGAGVVQQQSFQEHQQQSYQHSAASQQSIQQQSWSNYQNLSVINAEVCPDI